MVNYDEDIQPFDVKFSEHCRITCRVQSPVDEEEVLL